VPVVFDLGTIGDFVTESREDAGNAVERARQWVQRAVLRIASWQGAAGALAGQTLVQDCLFEHGLARGDRRADSLLGAVDLLAMCFAFFRRQLAERLELLGDQPRLAEQRYPQRIERIECRRDGNLRTRVLDLIVQTI
jgi:hypothetical protein